MASRSPQVLTSLKELRDGRAELTIKVRGAKLQRRADGQYEFMDFDERVPMTFEVVPRVLAPIKVRVKVVTDMHKTQLTKVSDYLRSVQIQDAVSP